MPKNSIRRTGELFVVASKWWQGELNPVGNIIGPDMTEPQGDSNETIG